MSLPEGYRFQRAHTTKWAVFGPEGDMVGWVRRTAVGPGWSSHGSGPSFYSRTPDEANWTGPFSMKDMAALELIERVRQ